MKENILTNIGALEYLAKVHIDDVSLKTRFLKRINDIRDGVIPCCKECGDKLTLPDELKYGICRGCGSEFITRRYL